jgi:archaellum component FlaC
MTKLYQLSEQYRIFNQYVENSLDSDEELTEDDLQTFIDTLESIEDSIQQKSLNVAKFIKNLQGDIDAYDKEIKRLTKAKKYLNNKVDGLKDYLLTQLQLANIKKVEGDTLKIKIQKNNPSAEIVNESAIPAQFRLSQPDKIQSKAILDALKQGQQVDGAVLVTDKEHLRIG